MKLRRLIASFASACVAVSAMTVVSSAAVGSVDTTNYMREGDPNGTVFVLADKDADPNWSADTGISPTEVYGVTYHIEFNADEVANEATWIGGGIGANSQSTGWLSNEWGRVDKPIIADLENGTVTWLSETPVFAEDDTYCQFWIQAWGGTIAVKGADILGADGNVIDVVADAPAGGEDLGGTVNTALYVGENVTWVTASSDTQAISTTGEYTFTLDGLAIAPSALTVIYVKDADVESKATTETAINADTQIITKSVKINGTELALTDGYNTALTKNVLDVCWYNIWGTNYVSLDGIDEINSVEVTVELALGAAEEDAADEDAADEDAAEDDAADEDAAEEDDADEDVAAEVALEDCYNNGTVILVADDGSAAYVTDNGLDILDVYGYRVTAQFPMAEVNDEATWIGGGIGTNANSTGWASTEWGKASGEKPIVTEFDDQGVTVLELVSDASLFAADDAYAQLWIQCWGGTMNIISVEVLGADGEVIAEAVVGEVAEVEAPAEDAADEDAADEDEAPATGDVDAETDSSKGSPDTGVEDVAVVAGLAIVAAGAVLVSKKRK
ncbi:MAG: LPXTG cell wall anchor domain-containing protein [Ruminococcus sp.]|nr:LPXTG cell wall anchor domain-containing protein [Ruminococcus sp.]